MTARVIRDIHNVDLDYSLPEIYKNQTFDKCNLFGSYVTIMGFFCLFFPFMCFASLLLDIVGKWICIRRRVAGNHSWDVDDYCQRWQLYLVLTGSHALFVVRSFFLNICIHLHVFVGVIINKVNINNKHHGNKPYTHTYAESVVDG